MNEIRLPSIPEKKTRRYILILSVNRFSDDPYELPARQLHFCRSTQNLLAFLAVEQKTQLFANKRLNKVDQQRQIKYLCHLTALQASSSVNTITLRIIRYHSMNNYVAKSLLITKCKNEGLT